MYFLATILPLLALASASHAPPHLRHRRLAHAIEQREAAVGIADPAHLEARKAVQTGLLKRGQVCRPRPKSAASSSSSTSSTATSTATTTQDAAQTPSPSTTTTIDNQNAWAHKAASTTAAPTTQSTSSPAPTQNSGGWHGGNGLLSVNDPNCGWCNSDDANPNGSQDWLMCGMLDGRGWTPPQVTLDQIKAADLDSNGVFAPCSKYFDMFRQYGGEFGIPPILLASFAMQESTCNEHATGGGGEAGLMQIAPPNCQAGHNCWEINYNIRRGAELFSNMVNANGGNVVAAVGSYNGWRKGLSMDDAQRAKWQGNCFNQNNLDYLTQFFNGWLQNKSGYSLGKYFNLKGC